MEKYCLFCIALFLTAGFSACAGCISSPSPENNTAVSIPVTPLQENKTIIITARSTVTTKKTPVVKKNTTTVTTVPTPDPVDVSGIMFVRYADSDISLEYPSSWTVTNSTYTSYNCVSTATRRCYQKEIKSIGPFDFREDAHMKKTSRIVTFTSADRRQKLVVFTSDFGDNFNGNYVLDPTLEWCKELITANFVDVSGSVVGDYQYSQSGNTMTSRYSVTMPKGSAAYPLAYTMKNYVTIHHTYAIAFISDTDNLEKYRNLQDRIISSVVPNDRV
ncbi:MAG: hypothetical protein WC586_10235 [Methanoregula sp.]